MGLRLPHFWPIKMENLQLRAGISIGVGLCPQDGQDANLLMQRDDVAMDEAEQAKMMADDVALLTFAHTWVKWALFGKALSA